MAIVNCPNCGKQVRLQGLAAICPSCDHVVFTNPTAPKQAVEPVEPEAPIELTDRTEELAPIDEAEVQPEMDQGAPPQQVDPVAVTKYEQLQNQILLDQQRGERQVFRMIMALCMAVTLFLLILGIALALTWRTTPAAPVAINTPASPNRPMVTPAPPIQPTPVAPTPAPSMAQTRPATRAATAPATRSAVVVVPAGPHFALSKIMPRLATTSPATVTDEQLGIAIKRGVQYLRAQFSGMQLAQVHKSNEDSFAGLNALATYALLHCGMTINDPELTAQSRFINGLLDSLTMYPMNVSFTTYSRSLRISALGILNRPQDRKTITEDLQWIRNASMQGAYTYGLPKPKPRRLDMVWDNSNSQYGALGAWAASEAGYNLDAPYWNEVQQHWLSSQTVSGGWAYGSRDTTPRLSMTAAGLNMLFVARDQLQMLNGGNSGNQPLSRSIERALDWLSARDNSVTPGDYRGYTLYGLERAGLASGYKYFGKHDWYQELAATLLASQGADGSWAGTPDVVTETSFALLFLSRGRHPVMMSKLKFYGPWNNRPRDVNLFTRYASYQLERQLNWEVADAEQSWWQWSDASLMLISSNETPNLGTAQIEKLRNYINNGGLILLNAEQPGGEFDQYAASLAHSMFPDYTYDVLRADHPIYSTVFQLSGKRELRGVSNGSRLLMVYCPDDLAKNWQTKPDPSVQVDSQVALNIAMYANGRRDLRNRVDSSYIPLPAGAPVGVIPMARIQHGGNWDPEPAAWIRASSYLQNQTGIGLSSSPLTPERLSFNQYLIAHLTGTSEFQCNDEQADALRKFVNHGGTLLIDACGGSKEFAASIERKLLPRLFPNSRLSPLNANHEILAENRAIGMKDLSRPLLRAVAAGAEPGNPMLILNAGEGQVIFSRIDLSTGLAGANTADLNGYQPQYCQDFITNLMLWKLRQIPGSRLAAP